MSEKKKFAFYWNASCGGCEIAVLDIDEKILDFLGWAEIVFWPVAMDFKEKDVERMPDGYIDFCFINGSVRTSHQEHMCKLLRKKSKVVIALGACSVTGGIPALANFANRDEIFKTAYMETVTTVNPEEVLPRVESEVDGKKLTLPEFYDVVKATHQVIDVDYFLGGCPPPPEFIANALEVLKSGKLPPKGSFLSPDESECRHCPRERKHEVIKKVYRVHEKEDDGRCFLDQGIICLGPVTRTCDHRCINANMPCRGCMGPVSTVKDPGLSMVGALAPLLGEELSDEEIEKLIESIPDPAGYFYRFTMSVSKLKKVR